MLMHCCSPAPSHLVFAAPAASALLLVPAAAAVPPASPPPPAAIPAAVTVITTVRAAAATAAITAAAVVPAAAAPAPLFVLSAAAAEPLRLVSREAAAASQPRQLLLLGLRLLQRCCLALPLVLLRAAPVSVCRCRVHCTRIPGLGSCQAIAQLEGLVEALVCGVRVRVAAPLLLGALLGLQHVNERHRSRPSDTFAGLWHGMVQQFVLSCQCALCCHDA